MEIRKGNLQQRRLEAINNPHQSVTSSGRCRMRFYRGRQLEHCRPFMDSPNLEMSRKRTSRPRTFGARAPRGKGSWYTALQLQFNVSRKHTRKESGAGLHSGDIHCHSCMNLHTIKGSRMHSFAWIPSEIRASIGEGGWNTAFGAWNTAVGTLLQNLKRAMDAHFKDFSFI